MLKNPKHYPGKHNYPQPRTSQALKPLEPEAQVILSSLILFGNQ